MAEIKAMMLMSFLDWYLVQPQRVRDQCLDIAEMKAAMRKLKTKEATDATGS